MKSKVISITLICLFQIGTIQAGTIEDLREKLRPNNVEKAENKNKSKNKIVKSIVKDISIVTCFNGKHSYAISLPPEYSESKQYPVLFCFDPGGDGVEAVKMFKYASEKYDWIVVGSLDAKNGPWAPILRALRVILRDVKQRYNVDNEKFYAAGFSGGARMAYTIAYGNSRYFKAVIACGSGFGQGNIKKKIAVYHCVGDEDFNLEEVKKTHNKLKNKKVKTELNEFSGDHRWPPTYVRNEAVDWIASIK